jgi:hypothetical protein
VRIAFDVSPLSHDLLGIGNYMQGSLGGLVEAAAGEHEIVAFAPTSIPRPERIRAALAGHRRRAPNLAPAVRRMPCRTAWSRLGHPSAERLARRCRRAPLLDWMYPPHAAGVRATTIHDLVPLHHPEWTTRGRARCTRRSTGTRPRPAT